MTEYEFTIHLDRPLDDEDYDQLYEAGFDDSTPGNENGRGVIHVTREADSLSVAILSTVEHADRAGFQVVGVEDEDLVSIKTIAARLERSAESVRLLSTGQRGPGGFPAPLSGDGWSLYSWAAVADWFSTHYGQDIAVNEHARVISAADHLLRARTLMPDLAELAALTA